MIKTPNIDNAKHYIFSCYAFGNYSFYPSDKLNSVSIALLKKNNWRDHRHVAKPTLTIQELVAEGLSPAQAKLCLFLIDNRQIFDEATKHGDDRVWHDNIPTSKWQSKDFIDRYYALAQWAFGQTAYLTEHISTTVKELQEIREKHLPEEHRVRNYDWSQTVFNFKKSIDDLNKFVSTSHTIDAIKSHFQGHSKISQLISRLEKGANSYNPYWMGSSKKLDKLLIVW